MIKTCLTKNGYRINKSCFSKEIIDQYRQELTVKPFVMDDDNVQSFPVYRETPSELIVPRYYGINKLGHPDKSTLKEVKINIKFIGQLRDYQKDIVNICYNYMKNNGGGLLSLACAAGKCLAKGTKILMFDGNIKNVEDLNINDLIMGDDSTSRKIQSLVTGHEEMFDIISKDNKYTVNRSHILSLKNVSKDTIIINNIKYKYNDIIDISVNDYLKCDLNIKKYLKGYRVKIEFPFTKTKTDPYLFGYNIDNNIIPFEYKINSSSVRLNLLAGIIDSHQNLNSKSFYGFSIIIKNISLLNDIIFLVRSLGYLCDVSSEIINIYGNDLENIPIKNNHSYFNKENKIFDNTYDINVKSIGYGKYYGFEIDGNRRFVLEDFTVTHNTVMAIMIACMFGLKTLVLVHKTFLQDQWIERVKQFTDANIGIIRQNKIQVENKDIVIGMIQSIAMKDYDPEIFNDFGLVIYDECHHVASRVYSNALYKTGAKYTFGLSATPDRADRLTKVINWYIGDMIYQKKNKINKQVIVKIFHYKSTNTLFREKKLWFKGSIKPSVPKMINNFCLLEERTKHLLSIINSLRKFPERKILILSGRKQHLNELKKLTDISIQNDIEKGIILPDECKTYFYTGDSKKKERKEAEENGDILFATYDLAHEGLDIERLNTIIMATPKKNIIQSVGRIMRKILTNGDVRPLIIDFTDEVSVFPNQCSARVKQYSKNKYKIENYYLKNNKLITFDTYMAQEHNFTQEEILQLENRLVYEPDFDKILDLQRVEEEDFVNENNNNIKKNCDINEEIKNMKNKKINYDEYLF